MTATDWEVVFLKDSSNESLAAFCDWLEEQGVDTRHIQGLRKLPVLVEALAGGRRVAVTTRDEAIASGKYVPGTESITTVDITSRGEVSIGAPGQAWAEGKCPEAACASLVQSYRDPSGSCRPVAQWWESRIQARHDWTASALDGAAMKYILRFRLLA